MIPRQKRLGQRPEYSGFHHIEEITIDEIDRRPDLPVAAVYLAGIISRPPTCYLLSIEPEDEDVISADFFQDFDVGTIESTDC